jgi:hypothetical protein
VNLATVKSEPLAAARVIDQISEIAYDVALTYAEQLTDRSDFTTRPNHAIFGTHPIFGNIYIVLNPLGPSLMLLR